MASYLSARETRSKDQRTQDIKSELPRQIRNAKENTVGYYEALKGIEPEEIKSLEDLQQIGVLRKFKLMELQRATRPFGGFTTHEKKADYVFQSPGPIYDPGFDKMDWWSLARFLNAVGIGSADIVQNCFSYHFTPAGKMMESAALSLGASVFPAGVGNTEQQAQAASDIGSTAYCGTPEYLLAILKKADELKLDVSKIRKAAVSGGPLFPQVRDAYEALDIKCLQAYATADIGAIAYESVPNEPMIVDENVLIEIVTPGTSLPVPDGEIGEVLVTSLNPEYPLIRFATGDLSAIAPGYSQCGRTNIRLVGWRGRADQAVKVKGMFVRPEQVGFFKERYPEIIRVRVVVDLVENKDRMTVKLEVANGNASTEKYDDGIREILKLKAQVEIFEPGALPLDGIVIEDCRPLIIKQ